MTCLSEGAEKNIAWLQNLASGHGFASYLIEAPEEAKAAAELIESLFAKLEASEQEREALLRELKSAVDACEHCRKSPTDFKCGKLGNCTECCGWEWRGPCEENGG